MAELRNSKMSPAAVEGAEAVLRARQSDLLEARAKEANAAADDTLGGGAEEVALESALLMVAPTALEFLRPLREELQRREEAAAMSREAIMAEVNMFLSLQDHD